MVKSLGGGHSMRMRHAKAMTTRVLYRAIHVVRSVPAGNTGSTTQIMEMSKYRATSPVNIDSTADACQDPSRRDSSHLERGRDTHDVSH